MNEITKKWLDIGFLCGMTDPYLMEKLAFKYEEVILLGLCNINTETLMFPVIRRVFIGYKHFNINHLTNHFNNWYDTNYERIELAMKTAMNGIDVEAEEISNYCNTYIEEFKNNITPMKHLSKHNL
jgi:hypothetical protein